MYAETKKELSIKISEISKKRTVGKEKVFFYNKNRTAKKGKSVMSRLWYQKPAAEWEEALPLGNGRMGAMVYGTVLEEHIQVNEDSIWYGGPVDRNNPDTLKYLPKIRELLLEHGIDLEALKADQNMTDVDDFDFICHVAFDKKPLTRRERAENVKKCDFLSKYSGAARDVLEALLDKYMNTGIYEIEKMEILRLNPFMKMGKPQKIASYFGGKDGYRKAVKELENAIYEGEIA